ncbi:MAG: hypothetical protein KF726_13785 [Anaerolineae bacterium]|nr:hypothetical protein [Anaerolineae bacterium]
MDFQTDYDGIREQLAAMSSQLNQMGELNQQMLSLANGLPGTALGGAAMISYVTYLQELSKRLGDLLGHSTMLTQTAGRAVSEIESVDQSLMQRQPQLP